MDRSTALVLWLDQVGLGDGEVVGATHAALGEVYRSLGLRGVRVPNGFIVTALAYRRFVEESGLDKEIEAALHGLDVGGPANVTSRGKKIRGAFLKTKFPVDLDVEIRVQYKNLCNAYQVPDVDTAVRSSATVAGMPDAVFTGLHDSTLHVSGEEAVLAAVRAAFASLYTDRAILYRAGLGLAPSSLALSVLVQKMVRADLSVSGVLSTRDSETGFNGVIDIQSAWGLGAVGEPRAGQDRFVVHKGTLRAGFQSIIEKRLGDKPLKAVYAGGRHPVKEEKTTLRERHHFSLADHEVVELARGALAIEEHVSHLRGSHTPVRIAWAKDGEDNMLYVVAVRPETVSATSTTDVSLQPHTGVPVVSVDECIKKKIGVHPLAVLTPDAHKPPVRKAILAASLGYPTAKDFYVRTLAHSIAKTAALFYSEPVIVMFSKAASDEYSALVGGEHEKKEQNPIVGLRGAARYLDPTHMPAFELECQALQIVRNELGFTNVRVAVPFCRTLEDGRRVLEVMESLGLFRGGGPADIQVYLACELPVNVLRADEFLDVFDGMCIDLAGLSQFTLGRGEPALVDMDSCDPGVRSLATQAMEACTRCGKFTQVG